MLPKTIEDTEKTETDREKIASEVKPVYTFSPDIAKNQAAIISSTFDYIIEVQKTINKEKNEKTNEGDFVYSHIDSAIRVELAYAKGFTTRDVR